VLYGRNPVREALRAGRRGVHRVWATPGAAREPWLRDVPVEVVDADEVARRAAADAHQGVCAAVDPYPYADATELLDRPHPLLVALDEVQDPQNVGAICRTAECVGATGVILPERRSATVDACGGQGLGRRVEHLAVARVRNLADFLGAAARPRLLGLWRLRPGPDAVAYTEPDWRGGVVLVLGSEGRGCGLASPRPATPSSRFPLRGRIASLNVSAAAAALLYGILQRRDERLTSAP
jgi:23S rRNA (guanosine2251-2'-O)-methyltransferase